MAMSPMWPGMCVRRWLGGKEEHIASETRAARNCPVPTGEGGIHLRGYGHGCVSDRQKMCQKMIASANSENDFCRELLPRIVRTSEWKSILVCTELTRQRFTRTCCCFQSSAVSFGRVRSTAMLQERSQRSQRSKRCINAAAGAWSE